MTFVSPQRGTKATLENVVRLDSSEFEYNAYVEGQVADVAYVVDHPELLFTDYGNTASTSLVQYLVAGAIWLMLSVVSACLFIAATGRKATEEVSPVLGRHSRASP